MTKSRSRSASHAAITLDSARTFLGDGGEMGALTRAYDWSKTPLGPPETWPQSLRTAVRLILSSRHPMFIWWGPDLIQFYNDAYRQTMGPERHPSALGDKGRDCWAEIWPIIGPQIELVMRGEGSTWHADQLVPVTRNGSLQQVWWTYGYSPIDDEDRVGGVLVVCNDVTETHLATASLALANIRLNELFSQAPGFIAVLRGPEHIFELTNAAYDQLVGHRAVLGQTAVEALPEVVGQGFIELLDRVFTSGEAHIGAGVPLHLSRSPGAKPELCYLDFVYQPVKDADGRVTGIFVEGHDVSDRVNTAERQKLLTEEMNHRVKNTLATVQALARLTSRSAKTVEEFSNILSRRIQAMAKTQDLLVQGHASELLVEVVIAAELAPYLAATQNVKLVCEAMALRPSDAVSLGLLVHELLTNAAKYGALSDPAGVLVVECVRSGRDAMMIWREFLPRSAPNVRGVGFGTQLIERLARDLGGAVKVVLLPTGLEATVTFRLDEDS